MSQFRADLHIHSRYSRATSKGLTPAHLAAWARVKGIEVVGTGDFTHPAWISELAEQCVEDGSGLLKLKSDQGLSREIPWMGGWMPQGKFRFILQAEISSIYKRGGKVRKVHNLVFMPSLDAARKFNEKLGRMGNLSSDGRPILGLDSRDLLEIVLGTDPKAFLVPAHIWTPWFSLFGSKSGFDSIEECFGDLTHEIFALETGLSSDPEMNWQWSALDRFRLISNSDAHSGEKLGRELNVFSGELTYRTIHAALRGEGFGQKFLGTVEFFPEEGKYHLDGHRKCGVVLEPRETMARRNICPVCGKELTVGVLHRVLELSDRTEPQRPHGQPGFASLVPLAELLGEVMDCGPATKTVRAQYVKLVSRFGSELAVLQDVAPDEIARVAPLLAEAVTRMRAGRVFRDPGFDGQFGVISMFSPAEKREITSGRFLIPMAERRRAESSAPATALRDAEAAPAPAAPAVRYNSAQRLAIAAGPGPLLVIAGPGTGKTHTLMGRIRRLIGEGENPRHILALTFTRRAAGELRERLSAALGEDSGLPRADTLHALAFDVWSKAYGEAPTVLNEESAKNLFGKANPEFTGARLSRAWEAVNLSRERRVPAGEFAEALHRYTKEKESWNLADYSDLLEHLLEQIEAGIYVSAYTHVLVDEVQDLSRLQIAAVKALAGPDGRGFFAIGDPDQSIYGFRGALADVRADLAATWPDLNVISLIENYRSSQNICDIAGSLFPARMALKAFRDEPGEIHFFDAPSDASEASWIGERVKRLLGHTSATLAGATGSEARLSPGDIAVLVRFRHLVGPIGRTLERLGIPVSTPETEAFWQEPRVAAILRSAERFLGMAVAEEGTADAALELPEKVLSKGPIGLSAYLADIAPFDRMFWQSRPFRELNRLFESQGGWVGLISYVHLQSELEAASRMAEKVQVMSLHASKGLEFEAVFLPALEDGILPFAGADFLAGKPAGAEDRPDEAEEKRLFFVGLSRARRMLYLSRAARRMLFGRELRLKPSRFLDLLPQDLIKASTLVARKSRQEEHLQLI